MTGPRRVTAAIAAALLLATFAYAQQIWVGGPRGRGLAPRWAQLEDFNGSFLYCRAFYTSRWRGTSGSGWSTDYPGADNNFSVRLAELTRIQINYDVQRQPIHVVVALDDPLLFRCPMLFMEDIGTLEFSPEELMRLREFLLKGGFLWVDDSWGSQEFNSWALQIARVLPPSDFPIFDVQPDHPIMSVLYAVKEVPQVPNIGYWRRTGGNTSELGFDSAEVYVKGIQDSRGRLMVLMTHNTDIADTWEREGENQDYFDIFSPTGYAIGVNVVLYAMTR